MGKRVRIENPACGKGEMVLGNILMFLGVVIGLMMLANEQGIGLGLVIFLIGAICKVVGCCKHWWWND